MQSFFSFGVIDEFFGFDNVGHTDTSKIDVALKMFLRENGARNEKL